MNVGVAECMRKASIVNMLLVLWKHVEQHCDQRYGKVVVGYRENK